MVQMGLNFTQGKKWLLHVIDLNDALITSWK